VSGGEQHRSVRATGGGAYKYASMFQDEIGISLVRLDEMTCVVGGLNFLLTSVDREVYTFKQPVDNAMEPSSSDHGIGATKAVQCSSRSTAATAVPSGRPLHSPTNPKRRSHSERPPRSMDHARDFVTSRADPFPYLLVNIGSGVSIVKVTGHGQFVRVSGSSLGGGTFWGLARLLLNCKTFDDVIDLTNGADNSNVDMLVADIYGGAYSSLGLDANIIAASFGKVTMRKDHEAESLHAVWRKFVRAVRGTVSLWVCFWLAVPVIGVFLRALGVENRSAKSLANLSLSSHFRPQDVALALLRMVSYNIGQIAYLNARVHGLERIYFGGNFIRDHPYTIADISFAVNFWSGGMTQALFLRHDGYLGAIGAFLGTSSGPSQKPDSLGSPVAANALATGKSSSDKLRIPNGLSEFKKTDENAIRLANSSSVSSSVIDETTKSKLPTMNRSFYETGALPDESGNGSISRDVLTKKKKRKNKKKKSDGADKAPTGRIIGIDSTDSPSNGEMTARLDTNDAESNTIYFDDVYHPTYRAAAEGDWQTVERPRRRTSGTTSQSESEDR
jgi:pantothenate kinase